MKISERLSRQGFAVVKNVISVELAYFFTHILCRRSEDPNNKAADEQVSNTLTFAHRTIELDTLLEKVWANAENYAGETLLPTYSYSRLYQNGNFMEKHIDKPTCEVSMTIQLGRSHEYSYPIFMGGNEVKLNVGDGVIYYGDKIEHWRDKCSGPEGYFSGQVFLHYVRENGKYKHLAGDHPSQRRGHIKFIKNRHFMF